jgi:uncharacterized protein YqjF (DUF2071 family)
MGMNYDLSPTTPLGGLHMVGTVRRRFLVSYPVRPELLEPWLPPGAEISTYHGLAWVSACFVDLANMRPSIVPHGLGAGFYYLIHRTRARLPYPDGSLRASVLVLEANLNNGALALLARLSTGIRFKVRDIKLTEAEDGWELSMSERGSGLFRAFISRSSIGDSLPTGSLFKNVNDADSFLLGVSYGGEWKPQAGRLRLLAETHDPWEALVGRCDTIRFDLLEKLGVTTPRADHVITMTDIPHYFALQGFDVPCPQVPAPEV